MMRLDDDIAGKAAASGKALRDGLKMLQKGHSEIKDIRGLGLLVGVEFEGEVSGIVSACQEKGLLVGSAGTNVLRCAPSLTIGQAHIDEAIAILGDVLDGRGETDA